MAQEDITCPSGLSLVVRGLKAKEMALLASSKNAKGKRNPTDLIYSGCTISVLDPGPYGTGTGDDVKLPWPKVAMADRFYAMTRIRACTWGDDYEFQVKCPDPECKHHKKAFVWDVPLSELKFKALPPASVEKLRSGKPTFDCTLGGRAAKFKLLTGSDEFRIARITNMLDADQQDLALIAVKIAELEGVDNLYSDDTEEADEAIQELVDFIGDRDLSELAEITDKFEDVDGGIETTTKAQCPGCGEVFIVSVPFELQAFLRKPLFKGQSARTPKA